MMMQDIVGADAFATYMGLMGGLTIYEWIDEFYNGDNAIHKKVARAKYSTGDEFVNELRGENSIVIGESQKTRVEPTAKALWSETYSGLGAYEKIETKFGKKVANFWGNLDNAVWLIEKMVRGYKIYDIGLDTNRDNRSSAYAMESILTFFYNNKTIIDAILTQEGII